MPERSFIQIQVNHLCDICRFTHKCIRFKALEKAASTIEENSLTKWKLDIDMLFNVKTCDLFVPDEDKIFDFVEKELAELFEDDKEDRGDS